MNWDQESVEAPPRASYQPIDGSSGPRQPAFAPVAPTSRMPFSPISGGMPYQPMPNRGPMDMRYRPQPTRSVTPSNGDAVFSTMPMERSFGSPVARRSQMPAWAPNDARAYSTMGPENLGGAGGYTPGELPDTPFLSYLRGNGPATPEAGGPSQSGFGGMNPGGLGYVPSAQRWNRLAPSEQAGFGSYLESQRGIHSPDTYFLMNKLRPQQLSSAPRWAL